jgi:hypothetical protein
MALTLERSQLNRLAGGGFDGGENRHGWGLARRCGQRGPTERAQGRIIL